MPDKSLSILKAEFTVHRAVEMTNFEKFLAEQGDKIVRLRPQALLAFITL